MRRRRFSEEQIIGVLKEVEAGIPVGEVCRKYGVCDQTYYRWKSKFRGLDVSEARRLRQLEDENRRLTVLLRREGWQVNPKRVYRLYRADGLGVRRGKHQRIGKTERQPLTIPTRRNERWSMDFISDALPDGRKFRSLNIVDDFNRECLVAEVDTSIPGARVVRVLERLRELRGSRKAGRTTGRSLRARRWTRGRINGGCGCISLSRGSPCRMLSSRASTARCGTNA